MAADAERWDARYREEKYPGGAEPSPFLREVLPLLPLGFALDIACGAGRNAVFLAAHGYRVSAMDSSRVALEKAASLATERLIRVEWPPPAPQSIHGAPPPMNPNAAATGPHNRRLVGFFPSLPGILLIEADLEQFVFPPIQCDLLICFNYLQRSLFPVLERSLRPGGLLVYETLTIEQLAFAGGPRNPAHLLERGELRTAFPALQILFYRELRAGKGIASLLARKPEAKS